MTRKLLLALLTLLVVVAVPSTALAAGHEDGGIVVGGAHLLHSPFDGRVVWGGTFTLDEDETLDGDLLIAGGVVTLSQGSHVTGSVVLFGGTLAADGEIDGDLVAFGGTISLGSTSVLHGDLSRLGAVISRAPGARVEGQEFSGDSIQIPSIQLPYVGPTYLPFRTSWDWSVSPFNRILSYLVGAFLMAALAVLVVMFWPVAASRTGRTMIEQPVITGAVGLLSLIVIPVILLILAITICLIPFSAIGFFALVVMVAYGEIGLGLEIGQRLGQMTKSGFHPAAAAGLGTLLLALVVGGIGMIPCVGWVAPFLVYSLALGGVILTRFGSRPYAPAPIQPLPPVTPPAPIEPLPPEAPEAPAAPAAPRAPRSRRKSSQ